MKYESLVSGKKIKKIKMSSAECFTQHAKGKPKYWDEQVCMNSEDTYQIICRM